MNEVVDQIAREPKMAIVWWDDKVGGATKKILRVRGLDPYRYSP